MCPQKLQENVKFRNAQKICFRNQEIVKKQLRFKQSEVCPKVQSIAKPEICNNKELDNTSKSKTKFIFLWQEENKPKVQAQKEFILVLRQQTDVSGDWLS